MEEKIDIVQTPTGPSPDLMAEIDNAAQKFDLPKLVALLRLPEDVIQGLRVMKRKERRRWYRDNKARLQLPPWDQLETLNKK